MPSTDNKLIPIIVFLFLSIIVCQPIISHITYWGQMDWDNIFFWNGVARESILKYHQLPLWNPYSQVDRPLASIAFPNSPFLSPFFIFVLIFGAVPGSKILVILHLFIGLWGMFELGRYLKMDKISSYMIAFVFMLSSIYSLHLAEGHFEWLTMAFVPWLFIYFLKSLKNIKYILSGCFFLSLIILGGSIDVLTIIVPFMTVFSLLLALQKREIKALKNIFIIFTIAFLICSVKLVPTFEYLNQYPRKIQSPEITKPSLILNILLDRKQGALYEETKWHSSQNRTETGEKFKIDYGWHEYGAYVGLIPILAFLIGVAIFSNEYWPLLATGFLFLIISLGNIPFSLWRIMRCFPVYNDLRVPSRYILGFIFSFSIFAGFGLQRIRRKIGKVCILITVVVFVDLWMVDRNILQHAFTIQPPQQIIKNENFFQQKDFDAFAYENKMRSGNYLAFLSNKGVLKTILDSNIPKGEVIPASSPEYRGEAYLFKNRDKADIVYFSPNKVVVKTQTLKDDILVLNQNYYKGWKVKKDKIITSALSTKGLISIPVNQTDKLVTFFYLPDSFIIGALISAITILAVFLFLFKAGEER